MQNQCTVVLILIINLFVYICWNIFVIMVQFSKFCYKYCSVSDTSLPSVDMIPNCDGSKVVSVQGFGFFSECIKNKMDTGFQVKEYIIVAIMLPTMHVKIQFSRKFSSYIIWDVSDNLNLKFNNCIWKFNILWCLKFTVIVNTI